MKIINTMYLWSQCSIAKLCLTVCEPMDRSTPGCPVFHYLLEFCSNSCPLSWWCHPTISSSVAPPFPPALNVSQHQGFSSESALHIRWPKFWSFSISPSNEYSGLTSFKIDWFDLLSRVFPNTTVRKHQFFGAQPSVWSNYQRLCLFCWQSISWTLYSLSIRYFKKWIQKTFVTGCWEVWPLSWKCKWYFKKGSFKKFFGKSVLVSPQWWH